MSVKLRRIAAYLFAGIARHSRAPTGRIARRRRAPATDPRPPCRT